MGTRADFYVGRGKDAEWIGSIAWDGYPKGISPGDGNKPPKNSDFPLRQKTEKAYRESVASFLAGRDDATLPDQGWPWPWDDSQTSDYAYAFDDGKVWAACFGKWFDASEAEPDEESCKGPKAEFPNMSARRNMTMGRRSGLIVIGTAP